MQERFRQRQVQRHIADIKEVMVDIGSTLMYPDVRSLSPFWQEVHKRERLSQMARGDVLATLEQRSALLTTVDEVRTRVLAQGRRGTADVIGQQSGIDKTLWLLDTPSDTPAISAHVQQNVQEQEKFLDLLFPNARLGLLVREPNAIITIGFGYHDNFLLEIDFPRGDRRGVNKYQTHNPSLEDMTDKEHAIISYYLDHFMEETAAPTSK